MATNGYLKIKTKIDNKEVDKDISELENKIKKLQTDNANYSKEQGNIELKIKREIEEVENKIKKLQRDNSNFNQTQKGLQQELNRYEDLIQKAKKYEKEINNINSEKSRMENSLKMLQSPESNENKKYTVKNGTVNITDNTTGLNQRQTINAIEELKNKADQVNKEYQKMTSEIDKQASGVDKIYTKLEGLKNKQEENNIKISEYKSKIESIKVDKLYPKLDKLKSKQEENNIKISQFKDKIEAVKVNKMQNQLGSLGTNIQNQISKIGKMTLAIFGIRTAWSAVRSAIGMVEQFNSQVATDFEYMRFCIANMLAPAVQWLIQLLYTVLGYVNAIMNAWFGINMFSNSSAKAFQKMKNSAGKTAKSAKEIQKSLQGFDEMNVLQDNSKSDNGGSSGGVATPSVDLSKMQADVPAWLKWIIDNGEIVKKILEGIATAILVIKGNLTLLQGLGIFMIIDGVMNLIRDLKTYLDDPTWSNFAQILKDIGEILMGIGLVIGISIEAPLGLILLVIGQILSMAGGIIEWFEALVNFIQDPSWENYSQVVRGMISSLGLLGDAILWIIDNVFGGWDNVTKLLETVGTWIYDNVIKPVGDIFQRLWNKIKEIFAPVIEFFSSIWNTVSNNIKIVIDNIKQIFMFLWGKICEIFTPVGQFFANIFTTAYQKIMQVFSPISNFFKGIWSTITQIFTNIGQRIGQAISSTFKTAVNAVLRTMENILNTPIRAINSLIGVINAVPGINLTRLSTFSLPRLAKGGIISQPTQAIIGEAGREAVIPLENNLEYLDAFAEKIASKLGGNGTVNVYLDSRLIQRQITKRNNELAFAMNR